MKIKNPEKMKILWVDDNDLSVTDARSEINELGYNIDAVSFANEVFDKVDKYNLIFISIKLPEMTEINIIKKIREVEKNLKKPHQIIIGLTDHVDLTLRQKCITAGLDGLISKPLTKIKTDEIFREYFSDHEYKIEVPMLNIEGNVIDLNLETDIPQIKKMIDMLIAGFKADLPSLQKAKKEDNWEKIRSLAHKYRGGSSYCGAYRLHMAAKYLEDYLRNSNETDFRDDLYEQFLTEMSKLIVEAKFLSEQE